MSDEFLNRAQCWCTDIFDYQLVESIVRLLLDLQVDDFSMRRFYVDESVAAKILLALSQQEIVARVARCFFTQLRRCPLFAKHSIIASIPWAVRLSWLENVYTHPLVSGGDFDP